MGDFPSGGIRQTQDHDARTLRNIGKVYDIDSFVFMEIDSCPGRIFFKSGRLQKLYGSLHEGMVPDTCINGLNLHGGRIELDMYGLRTEGGPVKSPVTSEAPVIGLPGQAWPRAVRHPEQEAVTPNIVSLKHSPVAIETNQLGITRESLGIGKSLISEAPPEHREQRSIALGSGPGEIVLAPDIVRLPEMLRGEHQPEAFVDRDGRHAPFAVEFIGRMLEIIDRSHGTIRSVARDSLLGGIRDVEDARMKGGDCP